MDLQGYAKVLQVAPKPPPDSGAKKDYCLIPGGYPGVSDFPHTGRSQKQIRMQFLDHLTSLEAAQSRRDKERRYTNSSTENEECRVPTQKSYSSSETLKAFDHDSSRLLYGNRVKDMVHREADEYSRQGSDADTENEGVMSPEHAMRLWGRGVKSGRSSCLSSRSNSALTLTDTEHENKSDSENVVKPQYETKKDKENNVDNESLLAHRVMIAKLLMIAKIESKKPPHIRRTDTISNCKAVYQHFKKHHQNLEAVSQDVPPQKQAVCVR
ncbi:Teneurin-3-like protein [Aix galericulata]|nr:Teneurin-3-like protein [Aix galericulata]